MTVETMVILCSVSVLLNRVVKHSERPFAYGIDWLSQRLLGKLISFYNSNGAPSTIIGCGGYIINHLEYSTPLILLVRHYPVLHFQ